MKNDFFGDETEPYHVSSYFFRVEFQQRGAPHIHSLIWLKNKEDEDAPNYWINSDAKEDKCKTSQHAKEQNQERIIKIEKFADLLITTSPDDMCYEKHM